MRDPGNEIDAEQSCSLRKMMPWALTLTRQNQSKKKKTENNYSVLTIIAHVTGF